MTTLGNEDQSDLDLLVSSDDTIQDIINKDMGLAFGNTVVPRWMGGPKMNEMGCIANILC